MSRIDFDFNKLAKDALSEIGSILVEQAKDNMQEVSFGKSYVIGGRVHIASKAGDTANNQSGALSKTIRYEVKNKELEFGAGNAEIDYAKYLEEGTSKMKVRPNYTKSIIQNEKKINRKVQDLFMQGLRFK